MDIVSSDVTRYNGVDASSIWIDDASVYVTPGTYTSRGIVEISYY